MNNRYKYCTEAKHHRQESELLSLSFDFSSAAQLMIIAWQKLWLNLTACAHGHWHCQLALLGFFWRCRRGWKKGTVNQGAVANSEN